jgi:hypothetical protein
VIVRGHFHGDAPYFNAQLLYTGFRGYVWFLADTGATRTLLSAFDAKMLGVRAEHLEPTEKMIVSLGGSLSCFRASNVRLTLDADEGYVPLSIDLYVARYEWERLEENEIDRLFRLPSIMGRDILNRFRFTCDRRAGIVLLEQ